MLAAWCDSQTQVDIALRRHERLIVTLCLHRMMQQRSLRAAWQVLPSLAALWHVLAPGTKLQCAERLGRSSLSVNDEDKPPHTDSVTCCAVLCHAVPCSGRHVTLIYSLLQVMTCDSDAFRLDSDQYAVMTTVAELPALNHLAVSAEVCGPHIRCLDIAEELTRVEFVNRGECCPLCRCLWWQLSSIRGYGFCMCVGAGASCKHATSRRSSQSVHPVNSTKQRPNPAVLLLAHCWHLIPCMSWAPGPVLTCRAAYRHAVLLVLPPAIAAAVRAANSLG